MTTLLRSVSRRVMLGGIAASGAALTLPGMAHAKMPMGQPQSPYFHRFKLGDAECTVVSDGQLPLGDPTKSFLNISKDEIAKELHDNFLPRSNAVLEQNVLVVNFGDRVVLFDTGMGTDALFGDSTGKLMSTLKQAGIDPAGVDAVVMSHAHIDHCGGLVADNGSHNFPERAVLHRRAGLRLLDRRCQDSARLSGASALPRPGTEKPAAVEGPHHFYKDNEEIIPGVTVLSAPGHTVSHSIFMINSGGKQLCYIGDLAHHPVLLLEHPRTQFAFDTDPVQSAESRVRMLSMLAANRTPLLAYHFAWPGIGHVAKAGDGFKYFPLPLQQETVGSL